MKNSWTLIIVIAAILAGLALLSSFGKKPPLIPRDAVHSAITTQEGCVACHAPGKRAPLGPNHPPKEQCLLCHKGR